eukprot:TRINITY_DN1681_c0_g1_i1.p1 TRINITY_DN1681_c0_g1~~TRINITY_DN1681_c0_g1_i1.p1  ORF type:complete len:206 (-),score=73.02 TRINITY_DN1681_c0_g1_i1:213-830(-)
MSKVFVKNSFINIIPFAYKLFEGEAPKFTDINKEDFVDRVNEIYENDNLELVEGYAPFCKHLFIPNFTNAISDTVELTEENMHLVRTDYKARTEKELPVLERWFPRELLEENNYVIPKGEWLDIILYSKEQILIESRAMNEPEDQESEWGIVSVKVQQENYECPMQPITMLRNSLGKEYGGSGVPLEEDKYQQSVEFWKKYVLVK